VLLSLSFGGEDCARSCGSACLVCRLYIAEVQLFVGCGMCVGLLSVAAMPKTYVQLCNWLDSVLIRVEMCWVAVAAADTKQGRAAVSPVGKCSVEIMNYTDFTHAIQL
jgi:hypothetical protein